MVSWIPYNIVKALQVASGWLSPDHSDFRRMGRRPSLYLLHDTDSSFDMVGTGGRTRSDFAFFTPRRPHQDRDYRYPAVNSECKLGGGGRSQLLASNLATIPCISLSRVCHRRFFDRSPGETTEGCSKPVLPGYESPNSPVVYWFWCGALPPAHSP